MTIFPGAIPGRLAKAASLPVLLLLLFTLALGPAVILSTSLYQEMLNQSSIQRIEFFLMFFPVPFSLDLLVPTLLAFGVYFGCFAIAFQRNGGYLRTLTTRCVKGQNRVPNWLAVMPMVASALLVVVLLITRLQESFGVLTGGLTPLPPPELFGELVTSPISEELSFRITTLGLLVAARSLISTGGKRSGYRSLSGVAWSFLEPDTGKLKSGLATVAQDGFGGIHLAEWVMLLLTSAAFGISHLGPQSSWDVGKVSTATLSGFVIGLSYLTYGAYAAFILHWFFNYYLQFYSLLVPVALPSQNTFYPMLTTLNAIVNSSSVFLGVLGILLGAMIVWEKIRGVVFSSGL